jgi:hypothetical protein
MLKQITDKVRELLEKARPWTTCASNALSAVRYTGTPSWKPWRDYDLLVEDDYRSR